MTIAAFTPQFFSSGILDLPELYRTHVAKISAYIIMIKTLSYHIEKRKFYT